MSTAPSPSLEERLAAVEAAVADLRRRLPERPPAPDWLDRVTGSFKDEPAFDEVLRYGREFREADRPAGDDAP